MSDTEKTRPMVKWTGGKSRQLNRLLPLILPHQCYCEPFAGGLALLMAKPRSQNEVINDMHGELIGLYRYVQYHPRALMEEIKYLHHSRQNLQEFRQQPGLTELQRVARFFVLNRTSFGANGNSYAVPKSQGVTYKKPFVLNLIRAGNRRLNGVQIEHGTWQRMVEVYDGPNTFFFFDPPYISKGKGDEYDWFDEAKMREVAAVLPGLKGQWLLTVNDSPFTRELFHPWCMASTVLQSGAGHSVDALKFGELIIRSQPFELAKINP